MSAPTPPQGARPEHHRPEVVRSAEQLRVSTRSVPYERVRVSKRIVTRTETRTFEVRREELVIVREDAGERLGGEDQDAEDELEIVLHREELHISKRVIPYERVRIAKTTGAPQDRRVTAALAEERVTVETDRMP